MWRAVVAETWFGWSQVLIMAYIYAHATRGREFVLFNLGLMVGAMFVLTAYKAKERG